MKPSASSASSACTRLPVAVLLALFLTGAVLPAEPVDHFADNGFAKPLSTMQHPCAEYFKGVTYIAYQGPHEDPYVCAYNHATRTWTGPVKAGTSTLGKTPDPTVPDEVDNHGRPALLVDADGYIHLVFGGHGGSWLQGRNPLGTPGSGRQTHVVSKNPEDISSWEVLANIPPSGTYSQFVKIPDGDIYLFYRHGSHRSDWVFQKSTDQARTFAPPVSILKHQPQAANPIVHDAWYAWFHEGPGDKIAMTFNYHPCASVGHKKSRYNVYYMQMSCADDSWRNVRGEAVTLPVTKELADRQTLVADTGAEGVHMGVCRMDGDGRPHLYARQGAGQVRYYRWTGEAWQGPTVVTEESKSQDGDFEIESPLKIRMVLSQTVAGKGEASWWKTTNGGLHWEKDGCLRSAENTAFLLSALVRNAHPDARVVVSELKNGQDNLYRKMFLIGDHGPVKRE
jgi:hypothetical protein